MRSVHRTLTVAVVLVSVIAACSAENVPEPVEIAVSPPQLHESSWTGFGPPPNNNSQIGSSFAAACAGLQGNQAAIAEYCTPLMNGGVFPQQIADGAWECWCSGGGDPVPECAELGCNTPDKPQCGCQAPKACRPDGRCLPPLLCTNRDNTNPWCTQPTPTVINPPPVPPQSPNAACGFYLRLKNCMTDCNDCQKNRLTGYYQTCYANQASASGLVGNAINLPPAYAACANNPAYTTYVPNMMSCLQQGAAGSLDRCLTCESLVNGFPGQPTTGIIGVHTPCNATNNFCTMIGAGGPPTAMQCFGASLGFSWGAVGGPQSPIGLMQSVGLCHAMAQALTCGGNIEKFLDESCTGFVDSCMSTNSNFCEGLFGMDRRPCCVAACPGQLIAPLINQLGIVPGPNPNPALVLQFEQACMDVLSGQGAAGLLANGIGGIIAPGPMIAINIFRPGPRDPCITY